MKNIENKGKYMATSELAQESRIVTNLHVSGYELTYSTIHNIGKYNLTATAKLVLILLTTHYNESKNGNVVFPSMPYIAETLGIGLTATKKAIKDLIEQGLILKSKRNKVRGNLNKYGLSPRLKEQKTTAEQSKNEPLKRSENDRFMLNSKKKLNKETTNNKVVAFSSNSHKTPRTVNISDVPTIIRDNKSIKNPCAYWAALSEKVKNEYLQKEQESREKAERIRAMKEEEEKRKEEERRKAEIERNLPPFYEREDYTREQGLKFVANMPQMMWERGIFAKAIMNRFNITREELLKVKGVM